MALLHAASIRPTKIEMLRAWAPTQPWFTGDDEGLEQIGAYRFDDPDGEVGIETFLVRSGDGPVLQIPVTYRGEALAGACIDRAREQGRTSVGIDSWER